MILPPACWTRVPISILTREATGPVTLIFLLYGKADCCLCDRLDAMIQPHLDRLASRATIEYRKVDITTDRQVLQRYRFRIPVLTCDGVELLEGRPEPDEVDATFAALGAETGGGGAA
jgi:hypothetical protein